MKFLSLVWGNLMRRKLRTALTMLSIFVAFLLYGLLCTINQAFTGQIAVAGADRLIVMHKVSLIRLLPEAYKARMEQMPGVATAVHFTWFNGIYKNEPKNFFATLPTEPEGFLAIYPEYMMSEQQKQAWLRTRNGAIAGRTLVNRFKWKIGDRIALVSPIWPRKGDGAWEFELVGIYDGAKKATDTSSFYFRYDYFDEARVRGEGEVGWYGVKVDDPARAGEVATAINNAFANSAYETKAQPEGVFLQEMAQQVGDIGRILVGVLIAVFFTILLVAGNTMAQAVRERTEELGVLKAMGFTSELVLSLVLVESCLIAAVGGLAGLGFAWLFTLSGSPVPSMLPIFYLPSKYILIGAVFVLGLGILAGILPAIRAMRLQIAVALRRNA